MKPSEMPLKFGLLILALLMAATEAQATPIKALEFNVDGGLLSTDPEIDLYTFGEGVPEGDVFTIEGGLLKQRTLSNGVNYSYSYPDLNVTGGTIDPMASVALEARLRVLLIQGTSESQPGAFFQIMDGEAIVHLFFQASGLLILGHGFFPVDVFEFHTYRIEAAAGEATFSVLVDGAVLTQNITGFATIRNGFNFGDGGNLSRGGTTGADVDWDFIRLLQPADANLSTAIEEPAGLFVFIAGLLVMLPRFRNPQWDHSPRRDG